jgi:hypothetical protein
MSRTIGVSQDCAPSLGDVGSGRMVEGAIESGSLAALIVGYAGLRTIYLPA